MPLTALLTVLMLLFFIFISAMEYVRSLVVIRVGSRIDLELNKRVYTAAFEQNLKKVGAPAGQARDGPPTGAPDYKSNLLFGI